MENEKVIIVTGGSRGIGSSIVRNLATRGYQVACISRKGQGVEDAEVDSTSKDRIKAYACDVTDHQALVRTVEQIASDHNGIGGLVNNAGIHLDGPSTSFEAEKFNTVLGTNVIGPFVLAQIVHPYLCDEGGLIVSIGSFYDRAGVPKNAAYCASKAAIAAVSRCLAVEWARDNIRVVNIAPGFVETDLNRDYLEHEKFQQYLRSRIPMKRPAQPEEVGQLVGALFAENMPFLTGETIYLDGGQGILL